MSDIGRGKSPGGTLRRMVLCLVLFLVLGVSIASASIQSMIDNASPGATVEIPYGTYTENVVINKALTLRGINDPTVQASSGNIFTVTGSGVTITGFTIKAASTTTGIYLDNTSPFVVYNNIIDNAVGVNNNNASPAYARHCYWGDNGSGANKGKAGESGNNGYTGNVDADKWATAKVKNGKVAVKLSNVSPFTLDNTEARVKTVITGGSGIGAIQGSAEYQSPPYGSSSVPGTAARYVDAFVYGYTGGDAQVTITYLDSELVGVTESSLKPYLWTGTSWVLASSITRDLTLNTVTGTFPASLLYGSPIALVGQDWSVTIEPVQNPGVPITTKPVFTTFRIESTTDITGVYYQIDSYSGTWKPIQTGFAAKTWNWPSWAMTDEEWANLAQGSHTLYFRFTRAGGATTVGESGEVSWQFFKSTAVSFVRLIKPNGGETLNRQPFTIEWILPSTSSIQYIDLYYSRDGGTTYPYFITRLSSGTTFSWRSPNLYTNAARVKVTVRYTGGTEYSDTSDGNFTIVKGYSFFSWRPGFGFTSFRAWPKPPFSFRIG